MNFESFILLKLSRTSLSRPLSVLPSAYIALSLSKFRYFSYLTQEFAPFHSSLDFAPPIDVLVFISSLLSTSHNLLSPIYRFLTFLLIAHPCFNFPVYSHPSLSIYHPLSLSHTYDFLTSLNTLHLVPSSSLVYSSRYQPLSRCQPLSCLYLQFLILIPPVQFLVSLGFPRSSRILFCLSM